MIEERLDLAMRVGEIKDASLVARRSGTAVRVVAAAPSYIKRHGELSSPAELANHTCIVHDVGPNSDVWCTWPLGPDTASPISPCSKWPKISAMAGWFAY